MRILLLTTSFPLTPESSSGIFVERLVRRLVRHCQVCVLAPADDASASQVADRPYTLATFRYAPVRWQLLAHHGGGIPAALAARPWLWLLVPAFLVSMTLACLWRARRADVIFANWSVCGVVAGVVGQILDRPVITTLRGEDANRCDTSRIHRYLIGACLRLSGKVVTVSDDIARRIKTLFPAMAHKVVTIPNGVDVVADRCDSQARRECETVRVLMVGSLIPRKSVPTALHALASLPAGYSLTVLGDGPERSGLERLAAGLGLDRRVEFPGHVPPERVADWLADADVFVITSSAEGRPNAVLEAMASGLPVIGSDIPGMRELIEHEVSGELFPVDDSEALAAALRAMADPGYRSRLGANATRAIRERGLSWENTAASYMREFEQLLAGRVS